MAVTTNERKILKILKAILFEVRANAGRDLLFGLYSGAVDRSRRLEEIERDIIDLEREMGGGA